MTGPAPEVLRRQNVQLRQQLTDTLTAKAKLQMRNEVLEAENKALHARLDEEVEAASHIARWNGKT